jgi:thioredoxin 1
MPTFLVIKSKSVIETIRGANPSALTAAVRKAASDTGAGGASSTHFASKGRTLGSASQPGQPVGEGAFAGLQRLMTGNGGLADMAVRFVALYFVSLFAFDSFKAAEESPYNIRARR